MLPIGVFCSVEGDRAVIHAQVVSPDGESMLVGDLEGTLETPAVVLGERLATLLIQRGALELLPDPLFSEQ